MCRRVILNVELKISLVRDILFYEYDITNKNSDFRQVGLDWTAFLNTFSSQAGNPPTYYIPNVGSYNTVQMFTGSQVPDHWFIRDGTALVPPDNHPPLKFEQLFNAATPDRHNWYLPIMGPVPVPLPVTAPRSILMISRRITGRAVLNAQLNPSFNQVPLINTVMRGRLILPPPQALPASWYHCL